MWLYVEVYTILSNLCMCHVLSASCECRMCFQRLIIYMTLIYTCTNLFQNRLSISQSGFQVINSTQHRAQQWRYDICSSWRMHWWPRSCFISWWLCSIHCNHSRLSWICCSTMDYENGWWIMKIAYHGYAMREVSVNSTSLYETN